MEQVQYDRIVSYLRTGSFPSKNKRFLRRKTKNFVIKDGLLFYSDKKKAADFQVLKAKAWRVSFVFSINQ